jgi:hypothetical protein
MALNTRLQRQRPHFLTRHQRAGQRKDWRGYPDDGVPWGTVGWASGPIAAPVLSTIAPTTIAAVAAATTVTCTGTGFIPESVIQVNGVTVPTTYVSATSLTTSYDPVAAGTTQFTVRNPDGSITVQKPFVIT